MGKGSISGTFPENSRKRENGYLFLFPSSRVYFFRPKKSQRATMHHFSFDYPPESNYNDRVWCGQAKRRLVAIFGRPLFSGRLLLCASLMWCWCSSFGWRIKIDKKPPAGRARITSRDGFARLPPPSVLFFATTRNACERHHKRGLRKDDKRRHFLYGLIKLQNDC